MAQQGSSNYRTSAADTSELHQGIMDDMSERAREMGQRARSMASELASAVEEHPYMTLAIAAGLAFAVGALWKLSQQLPQSRWEAWRNALPELPREALVPRRWR
jgi:ElaB/YqjD/DUF883 family membrane-anchored ribosome-binding protein